MLDSKKIKDPSRAASTNNGSRTRATPARPCRALTEPRARATARASSNTGSPRATARGPEQRQHADAARVEQRRVAATEPPARQQPTRRATPDRREQQLADPSNARPADAARSSEPRTRATARASSRL